MSELLIDYTGDFNRTYGNDALIAQGCGSHFLALFRLSNPVALRADGKKTGYELIYRELSQDCEREDDQAYACVTYSEVTHWQRKEFSSDLLDRIKDGVVNLFEEFNIGATRTLSPGAPHG